MEVVDIDTHTARHLLKRYFLLEHYHALDVEEVGRKIAQLSRDQYNADTLRQLQRKAHFTIGIPKTGEEVTAGRIAVETWITAEELLQNQLNRTLAVLIPLAKATQYFEILTSLKGISDILAALFIADSAPRP